MIAANEFRSDLFYRIGEVAIAIPPLRDRDGDSVVIAQALLERRAREHSRSLKGFAPDALRAIQCYSWPGNIRELENKVSGAVIMAEGKHVTASDLGLTAESLSELDFLNLRTVRAQAERRAIERAVSVAHGNLSRAAELLGITRPTLYDLLEKNQLSPTSTQGEGA
jgi:two-component system NtrC family response regulator